MSVDVLPVATLIAASIGAIGGVTAAVLARRGALSGKRLEILTWAVELTLSDEPHRVDAGIEMLRLLSKSRRVDRDELDLVLGMLEHSTSPFEVADEAGSVLYLTRDDDGGTE